jgi:hypothetical protein
MVKDKMTMNQGGGVEKEDRKSRKTREDGTRFSQETTYFGTAYSP